MLAGVDRKQSGIGLAAGITFGATVMRALLVPSIMRLRGKSIRRLPAFAARLPFRRPSAPEPT